MSAEVLADQWTPIGPAGASVGIFAVAPTSPRTILAGTETGIARSADGGATWQEGPTATANPEALVFDPVSPAVAYAAVPSGAAGVWKTGDGGVTWRRVFAGPVHALAAGRNGEVWAGTESGLYVSADGGAGWAKSLDRPFVASVAIDPFVPGRAYAGTSSDGAWVTDAGTGWRRLDGLGVPRPDLCFAVSVVDLLADPSRPGRLYASVGRFYPCLPFPGGWVLSRSDDYGATWTDLSMGFPLALSALAPDTLYAGGGLISRSRDAGLTWLPVNGLLQSFGPSWIQIDPFDPSTVYAADGQRLYRVTFERDAPCIADETSLCLWGGRFLVRVERGSPSGGIGVGYSMPLTPVAGGFWFWTSNNIELVVKVVDGREVNQQLWVFIASLSDVGYTVTVRDEITGRVKTYANPPGRLASMADTYAFY